MPKFRTHGKWILAGEHAVLRGGKALVFPLQSRYLDFEYTPSSEPLSLAIGANNAEHEMGFWAVFERALQNLDIEKSQLKGKIRITSNIPIGAGMGASATICVSLARWFSALGFLDEGKQFEFAKNLEDLFHGQSSGVDVAVALLNQPLEFTKPNSIEVFTPQWQPNLYLSYCGQPGITADCIRKVQDLHDRNSDWARAVDQRMHKAVENAKKALLADGDELAFSLLQDAIADAGSCFADWGLISAELHQHMNWLKDRGAVACKPTGSGGGGFVLSLWKSDTEFPKINSELIRA